MRAQTAKMKRDRSDSKDRERQGLAARIKGNGSNLDSEDEGQE